APARRVRCGRNWAGLDSSRHQLFGSARGADEVADHVGILDTGRALDAGGYIDPAGAGDANGFRDVAGIEAARNHEGQLAIEIFQHMPVEPRTEAAGPRGVFRGP